MSDTNDRGSSPLEHRHADTLRRLSDRVASHVGKRLVTLTFEEMEAVEWARMLVDDQNRLFKVVKR